LLDHRGIVRIQEYPELRRVELPLVGNARRRFDPVGVVKQDAQIADAADAGFRADCRLARLDARIAEDALLGFAGLPVVIDLLVRATRDAHAPTAAFLLIDENDAILFALVDCAGGARGDARRVETMLAQSRQIHQEGLLELAVNLFLDVAEIVVLRALGELAAEDLLPVGAPFDLGHPLARDLRDRPRRRRRLRLRSVMEVLVLEIEWLIVIVDLRQIGIGEDIGQHTPFAAHPRFDAAARGTPPAAIPAVLVLPVLRVADAWLALDVVEPGVLDAFPRGPYVLASHRAGMAADALVEIEDLADLRPDLHSAASLYRLFSASGLSFQSTSRILRMITNSSRLEPTVR